VSSYLSICAIYRDEAPYLREWIEFHRLVGVERFYLYNNLSQDGHREVLQPYVADGTVELRECSRFPVEIENHDEYVARHGSECRWLPQIEAYDDCLARHGGDWRWIAFIDVDEFLFSPTGAAVRDVLVRFERLPILLVPWAVFGSSGHKTPPDGLVTENYTWRSRGPRTIGWYKSIVDPRRTHRARGPHAFIYKEDINLPGPQFAPFDALRINHYWTRSEAEFAHKLSRPWAHKGKLSSMRQERTLKLSSPENSVLDDAIFRYLPALRDALGLLDEEPRSVPARSGAV
jgi:Glycosyltransferase family 92